jgi:hypothetical protein
MGGQCGVWVGGGMTASGADAAPVRVCISYAHEEGDEGVHARRVLDFWVFLLQGGGHLLTATLREEDRDMVGRS